MCFTFTYPVPPRLINMTWSSVIIAWNIWNWTIYQSWCTWFNCLSMKRLTRLKSVWSLLVIKDAPLSQSKVPSLVAVLWYLCMTKKDYDLQIFYKCTLISMFPFCTQCLYVYVYACFINTSQSSWWYSQGGITAWPYNYTSFVKTICLWI